MGKLFKAIWQVIAERGKMLIGYLLIANPWLTDYPTLLSSLQDLLNHWSSGNKTELAIKALAQAVMALGAGHRFVKVFQAILMRYKILKNPSY